MTEQQMFITNVIRSRKFHAIPDWMMRKVDADVFLKLFDMIGAYINDEISTASLNPYKFSGSQSLYDHILFLNKLAELGSINPKQLALGINSTDYCNPGHFEVLAYVFDESDWKTFFRYVDKRKLFDNPITTTSRLIFVCRVHMYRFSRIPKSVVDILLEYFDREGEESMRWFFCDMNRSSTEEFIPPTNSVFCMERGSSFVDAMMDVVSQRSQLYYWGELFDIYHIWDQGLPYYPIHSSIEQLICYLDHFSRTSRCVELSNRILQDIVDVIQGDYDTTIRQLIFEKLCDFVDPLPCNPNNIRFVMPFYGKVPTYGTRIDMMVRRILCDPSFGSTPKNNTHIALRDFRYLLPKVINNDTIQKKFLSQRGDPSTLISDEYDGDTFIRTIDGVTYAITNLNPIYVKQLLDDPVVVDFLIYDIIGKVPFSPIIERLTSILASIPASEEQEYISRLKLRISNEYPLIESDTGFCRSLLRISQIGHTEASAIVDTHPSAVFDIPVTRQSEISLFTGILSKCKENYVPLYFGTEADVGLEDALTMGFIVKILTVNNAYFADIRQEELAELLYQRRWVWKIG